MIQHQKYTDEELLTRFYQSQDNYWLGILLERYTVLLLGVCMKYLKNEQDAKDTVQQIFIKVLGELPKNKVSYFRGWVYTVTRNFCLMQIRSGKNRTFEQLRDEMQFSDNSSISIPLHEIKEIQFLQLEEAINELNEQQRICISQFYLEKKSYNEISQSTGLSNTQVKSYIQNGKRNLKILILKKQDSNG